MARGHDAIELARLRRLFLARAALERGAMRMATEDMQDSTDRIARIAVTGITMLRRYWLPASVLLLGGLFKRTRPVLRAAQTGLAIWQTVRMLRDARR